MSWERLWATRSLGSTALLPASWVYRLGVTLRPTPKPVRVDGLQVVSVGNLIAGGAGKTPVVLFLAKWALESGRRVAVLSRGYGRRSTLPVTWAGGALPSVHEVGDEPRLIARRLPTVELFIDADRVRAARAARASGCSVAILDDGFQHRRLERDLNLLIDSGIGNGRLLPAGPLREPLGASARADLIWARDHAQSFTAPLRVEASHDVVSVLDPTGAEHPITVLAQRRVIAVAGLARPSGFLLALKAVGAHILQTHLFRDHHPFSVLDVERFRTACERHDALLVTTEKDRERLPDDLPLWLPRVSVRVTQGRDALAARLGWL